MKAYGLVMSLLAVLGLAWLYMQNSGQPEGEAGRAYTLDERGQRIDADGTRGKARTVVDAMENPLGGDEALLSKFELIERSGRPVTSEELKGQPYVAGFFFSTCPSICVRQNSKVKELQDRFGGQPVRFLSISCDPEVDQPEVLAEYAKRFDADAEQWLFLTGKMKYLRRVGAEIFRLGVVRRGHPEKFALMDGNGKLYGLYTWSDDDQWAVLEQDIALLIEAGGVIDEILDANEASETGEAEVEEVAPHGLGDGEGQEGSES